MSTAVAREKYLSADENREELLSHMDAALRREWDSYGHLRKEPAFQDRVFIVYECLGRDSKDV